MHSLKATKKATRDQIAYEFRRAHKSGPDGATQQERIGLHKALDAKIGAASRGIQNAFHGFFRRKHWTLTEDLQRHVLNAMDHAFGPEHPDTLAGKSSLALILQAKGDLDGVEELHREVLDSRTRALGPDNPDTIASKNSLARVLLDRGDLEGAGELRKAVEDAVSRNLGSDTDHAPTTEVIEQLSPAIVRLNEALVDTIKGVIDAMYKGRDIQRFYVLETIARVPYFAYVSCLHMHESLGKRGNTELLRLHYAEADNELHHLLIIEALGGDKAYEDRFVAQHLAVFYYWYCVAIYLLHPRAAYHLSELIEDHAFHTYDAFLHENADELRKQPAPKIAREYYSGRDQLEVYFRKADGKQAPRTPHNLYDVFVAIREDEKAHWQTLSDLVRQENLDCWGEYCDISPT
jgi:ubiquinol oxidase